MISCAYDSCAHYYINHQCNTQKFNTKPTTKMYITTTTENVFFLPTKHVYSEGLKITAKSQQIDNNKSKFVTVEIYISQQSLTTYFFWIITFYSQPFQYSIFNILPVFKGIFRSKIHNKKIYILFLDVNCYFWLANAHTIFGTSYNHVVITPSELQILRGTFKPS
jgi:hypothetical protein